MILQLSNIAPPYNGRLDGSIITSAGTRAVGRPRIRPANARQRQRWRPPWTLAPGKAAFAALSSADQDSWNEWADDNFCWPIQGSPRFTTGEIYFANMYTVEKLFTGLTPSPSVPLELPTWQTLPKFFEFATFESGTYTLKAETDFDPMTELIFSGLPPSKTVFNGEWFGEEIIGADTLDFGLSENDEYSGVDAMMTTAFGSIDSTKKIWNRVWEKYPDTGFIRVLKDPCTINPTEAPPAATLTVEIYNAYFESTTACLCDAQDELGSVIGSIDFGEIAGDSTATETMTMEDPFTSADIVNIDLGGEWADLTPFSYFEAYDGSDPWEFTIDSIF